jgi:hypothetical protein
VGDEIKVKVSADGATTAASQVDKLTAALEKQRKTQELISKTSAEIKRQNVVDELKKQAAEVNALSAVFVRHNEAVANVNGTTQGFGDNTQQLRAKLGPAAALIGNLSSSFSVLIPEVGGAANALKGAGMAAGQMLGVLGGGPGIIIGGLVAGVGALAAIMASSKKEADELAKATEANAKAAGSYLDQLQKLRAEATASRTQQKGEGDLQKRLDSGQGSSDEYADEINTIQKRLQNQYYTDSTLKGLLAAGSRDEWDKRQQARTKLERKRDKYTGFQSYADEQAENARQQADDKRTLGLELEAAPDAKTTGKGTPGYLASQQQLEKLSQMQRDYADKEAERALQASDDQKKAQIASFLDEYQQKDKIMRANWESEAQMRAEQNQIEKAEHAKHMRDLAADRKLYQDPFIQGTQIMAGAAIKSFQLMAKGQKAQLGMILEGIGDQAVAMGTMTIFDGIAKSILLDARGPALIGIGGAEVAFGLGLGAVGAHSAGGSAAGGGKPESNPFGPSDTKAASPLNQNQGPTIININFPTVLSPSAADGQRVKRAVEQATRVYGG